MTLDDLRAANPHLGFALYAYTPGEPVTLEIIEGGQTFEFKGRTAAEAIARAFPPEPVDTFDLDARDAAERLATLHPDPPEEDVFA